MLKKWIRWSLVLSLFTVGYVLAQKETEEHKNEDLEEIVFNDRLHSLAPYIYSTIQ